MSLEAILDPEATQKNKRSPSKVARHPLTKPKEADIPGTPRDPNGPRDPKGPMDPRDLRDPKGPQGF